jgi:hypothetical protein
MRPCDRITLFIRKVVLHIAFNGDYVWPVDLGKAIGRAFAARRSRTRSSTERVETPWT